MQILGSYNMIALKPSCNIVQEFINKMLSQWTHSV